MMCTRPWPSAALRRARRPKKNPAAGLSRAAKPMAFARQLSTWVWIDVERRLLIIDAGSQARTDDLITALIEALDGEQVPGAGPVNIAA